MQIVRAIIVDDEEFAIIDLKEELASFSNVEVVATYSDGIQGLQGIHQLKPDLIFVDIEMPGLNGFEMLGRLEYSPVVIFHTGFSKYAVEGYEFNPADFLLKPLKKQRFQVAMERAFKDIERNELEERLLRQKQEVGYILLNYRDIHGDAKKVCVWPEDILFVHPQENNANYIEYQLTDGSVHLVKKPLKKAFDELEPRGFIQVHKSYLVNRSKIRELFKNESLILEGLHQATIPVSRGYRKKVKQLLDDASRK